MPKQRTVFTGILLLCLHLAGCNGSKNNQPANPKQEAQQPPEQQPAPRKPTEETPPPPASPAGLHFERVLVIVMENANYADVMADPYYADLASRGALFTEAYGVARPSYPNYLAMVGGETFGVSDSVQRTLDAPSLADLLDAKGLAWKMYAEDYPGNCFLGDTFGRNARKHVPFLSFRAIQQDPQRCANVLPATEFAADAAARRLPNFAMFAPNLDNDGHDTGIAYGAGWLRSFLEPLLADAAFMQGQLIVVTFDEAAYGEAVNRIYTVFLGAMVQPGATQQRYTHYSLLRTVEDNFALGTLGKEDASAQGVAGIWR